MLIYSEGFNTHKEALRRENFLKTGQGRKWLDHKFASTAPGSSNGRTQDSESCYLGSNPSPGAVDAKNYLEIDFKT
jgi:hypothetical protein